MLTDVETPIEHDLPRERDHLFDVHDLYTPRVWPWLWRAGLDWSIIVAALVFAGWLHHWVGYLLAVLVVGNRQHALGILAHDGAHRLITRAKRANDALVSVVCFWPLMTGLDAYRKFHFAHHRHLGTRRDPELFQKGINEPEYDIPVSSRTLLFRFFGDLCGRGIWELIKAQCTVFRPQSWADRLGPLGWWIVLGTVLVVSGNWWVMAVWFAALWTSMWAFFRLRIWSEHQGTGGTHRISVNWWQRLFTPHNTWCHYEHHKWPAVPFWKLPVVREFDAAPITSLTRVFRDFARAIPQFSGEPLAEPEIPADRTDRLGQTRSLISLHRRGAGDT